MRWPWKLYGERPGDALGGMQWSLYYLESDPGERLGLALEQAELTSELVAIWESYGR